MAIFRAAFRPNFNFLTLNCRKFKNFEQFSARKTGHFHFHSLAVLENNKNLEEKFEKLLSHVETALKNPNFGQKRASNVNLGLQFLDHVTQPELFQSIAELKKQRDECLKNLDELNRMLLAIEDLELKKLAEIDIENLSRDKKRIETEILEQLLPSERTVDDQVGLVLCSTAGAGGEEAMLFAKELFIMYENYARFKGWTFEIETTKSETSTSYGGIHSASAHIIGPEAFKYLRFESGVHRVQRVPITERTGRIHTSTASITVTPLPKKIDIQINSKDLRIDRYRSSGHGGQNAQMNESAIRLTHLPTKLVADCQQERSQEQNFRTAMERLKMKIYQIQFEKEFGQLEKTRKLQMGSRERSEKIRTYNFVDNRLTDHRIKQSFHNLPDLMTGGQSFDSIVLALLDFNKSERIYELLNSIE